MRKTVIIISTLLLILTIVYSFVWCGTKKYNYPLNTIENIKYFEPADKCYAYQAVTLTPTEYRHTPFKKALIAKAIYKSDTIAIKIEKLNAEDEITFRSIGKESDNFVKAMAALYDEDTNKNTTMRNEIKCWNWNIGGALNWHWFNDYNKTVATALNGRGADMYLNIMIPTEHKITIGDKNNGLSKKRFVDVFRSK